MRIDMTINATFETTLNATFENSLGAYRGTGTWSPNARSLP